MRFSKVGLGVAAGIWLALVGAGIKAAMDYESAPGRGAAAPTRWPAETALGVPGRRARLILFAHPRCPCTRATVEELLEIVARAPEKAKLDVCFYRPSGAPAHWNRTDLWRRLVTQADVRLYDDEGGREAKRFGAATSGTVLLFDTRGRQVFSGGVTPLRGRTGDNMGRQAVLSFLLDGKTVAAKSPVFGCSLFEVLAGPATGTVPIGAR